MAGRRCIFCDGSPVSREHVLPEWFRKMVNIDEPRPGSVTHHTPGNPTEIDFEAIPVSRTAKVVCESCNNGWMSQLEAKAAVILTPLLQGQSGQLSEDDLAVLAQWAFKTAYVIDAASQVRERLFPASIVASFASMASCRPAAQSG
jgi:hypothetical protein